MVQENRNNGILCEKDFSKRLKKEGITHIYLNGWCDFIIKGSCLDVKSTLLYHKFTRKQIKKQSYKIGRYQFSKEQQKQQMYIAFYIRHNKEFMFLGIGKINKNSEKYLSLGKIREIKLLTIKEFIQKLQNYI